SARARSCLPGTRQLLACEGYEPDAMTTSSISWRSPEVVRDARRHRRRTRCPQWRQSTDLLCGRELGVPTEDGFDYRGGEETKRGDKLRINEEGQPMAWRHARIYARLQLDEASYSSLVLRLKRERHKAPIK
ncbi:hypothetical protein BHM03_00061082, partial [Ensete ventricosum]